MLIESELLSLLPPRLRRKIPILPCPVSLTIWSNKTLSLTLSFRRLAKLSTRIFCVVTLSKTLPRSKLSFASPAPLFVGQLFLK